MLSSRTDEYASYNLLSNINTPSITAFLNLLLNLIAQTFAITDQIGLSREASIYLRPVHLEEASD